MIWPVECQDLGRHSPRARPRTQSWRPRAHSSSSHRPGQLPEPSEPRFLHEERNLTGKDSQLNENAFSTVPGRIGAQQVVAITLADEFSE